MQVHIYNLSQILLINQHLYFYLNYLYKKITLLFNETVKQEEEE
jgi:hypothetical protein